MAEGPLTRFQHELLQLFFSLPGSGDFILGGGAALVAAGLTTRPTQDVDLFSGDMEAGVASAADALEAACVDRGWTVERIRDTPTFCRLVVSGDLGEMLVDLAVDTPPLGPPSATAVGPIYSHEELAARKLLAVFGRAEARDFADISALAERFDLAQLTELAGQLDAGFDLDVLADMLASHERFTDEEFSELGVDPRQLRELMERWRTQLRSSDG